MLIGYFTQKVMIFCNMFLMFNNFVMNIIRDLIGLAYYYILVKKCFPFCHFLY